MTKSRYLEADKGQLGREGLRVAIARVLPGLGRVEFYSVLQRGGPQGIVQYQLHAHCLGLLQSSSEARGSLGADDFAALFDIAEVLPRYAQTLGKGCQTLVGRLAKCPERLRHFAGCSGATLATTGQSEAFR
jgi:hypothetical protein